MMTYSWEAVVFLLHALCGPNKLANLHCSYTGVRCFGLASAGMMACGLCFIMALIRPMASADHEHKHIRYVQ